MSKIQENLDRVRVSIAAAARAGGRSPDGIRLIAVSKTFPAPVVDQAVAAGQLCFGENRVQEAADKIPLVVSAQRLEWHLIGHLQSNKARKAALLFDWVHSVDSRRVLSKLDEGASEAGKVLSVLLQVDLGLEPTKSGMEERELEPLLRQSGDFKNVSLQGLMVLPPYLRDAEAVRPHFRRLREIRDSLVHRGIPIERLGQLSMGMSHDYDVAIQEGATMIRVGTAIFGPREKTP